MICATRKKKLIKMKKAFIAVFLQVLVIVLAKDLALSEANNRDNTTQTEANVKQLNATESATKLPSINENSTISALDKNSTEIGVNGTLKADVSTQEPSTTTESLGDILIPPATVVAQIVNADISTKKPSRIQIAA